MASTNAPRTCLLAAVVTGCGMFLSSGAVPRAQDEAEWIAQDRAIAMRFAPVFHQGLVGTGRFDYITNIDFDGDWVGDNNWENAANLDIPLKGHVYYAVSETPTHYFIHYAAFHPRDYKGGEVTGELMSQAVRRGAEASKRVTSAAITDEVVLAHENDLEGCLVVVAKRGSRAEDGEVVLVETLAHNQYLKYQPGGTGEDGIGPLQLEDGHPLIYVEPKGHGMQAYSDQLEPGAGDSELPSDATQPAGAGQSPDAAVPADASQPPASSGNGLAQRIGGLVEDFNHARKAFNNEGAERIRVYRFTGSADDPDVVDGDVGYELVSTYHTLWARAREGDSTLFADVRDYGAMSVEVAAPVQRDAFVAPSVREVKLGLLGASLRGVDGALNMARPPWGWFDATDRDRPLGEWFFDPANTVIRHVDTLRAVIVPAYVHHPFMNVFR